MKILTFFGWWLLTGVAVGILIGPLLAFNETHWRVRKNPIGEKAAAVAVFAMLVALFVVIGCLFIPWLQ